MDRLALPTLIVAALIGLLAIVVLVVALAESHKNLRRVDCRVCGCQLDKPGGRGNAWAGSGFCAVCNTKILREIDP